MRSRSQRHSAARRAARDASATRSARESLRHFSRKIINLYYANDFSLHRSGAAASHETSGRLSNKLYF